MQNWTAEQLMDAAQSAIDTNKFQDAVTVLGYVVQHYPASNQAAKARAQYKFLTGTDFPEVTDDPNGPTPNGQVANGNGAQATTPESDAKPVAQPAPEADKAEVEKPEETPEAPTTQTDQPSQTAEVVDQPSLVDQLDSELQLGDGSGRMVAHLMFAAGWLMLPIGVLMLLFSWAFGLSLGWSILTLLLAPLFIGLGQTMKSVFDLKRINLQLLKAVKASSNAKTDQE